jgi:5-methyltetrahydrofolate--homocysteine methyltransferase
MHATRLSSSGCEIIVARGFSPEAFRHGTQLAQMARTSAITSGCATKLPTWALFETSDGERVADGDSLHEAVRSAVETGVHVALVEVPSEAVGKVALETMIRAGVARAGVLLAASPESQHGVPDTTMSLETWAAACKRLVDAGARLVGGGAGTTSKHVAVLSRALKGSGRSGSDRPPLRPQVM